MCYICLISRQESLALNSGKYIPDWQKGGNMRMFIEKKTFTFEMDRALDSTETDKSATLNAFVQSVADILKHAQTIHTQENGTRTQVDIGTPRLYQKDGVMGVIVDCTEVVSLRQLVTGLFARKHRQDFKASLEMATPENSSTT